MPIGDLFLAVGLGVATVRAIKRFFKDEDGDADIFRGRRVVAPRRSNLLGDGREPDEGDVHVARPRGGDKMKATKHDVGSLEERIGLLRDLALKGSEDATTRDFAVRAVSRKCGEDWCVEERDYDGEVTALYDAVRRQVRYVRDVYGVDTYTASRRTLQMGGADCFPKGTLLLRHDHELVPIEEIKIGDEIWGLDRWSKVVNVWYKGSLKFDAIKLNNGSWVHLTPGHKIYVAHCDRHSNEWCACPIAERRVDRITVAELQPRMVLLAPDRVPFGRETMDPDRAYVEGLYLADGWSSHNADFSIAGRDGFLKEAQKHKIVEICNRLGIPTRWHRRYVTVKDKVWALRTHLMGLRAPGKHALSIGLDEGAAGALLRGIMADSGANTHGAGRTFTSTSRLLAIQMRVLHRMFGVSCGWSYIEEHGGLGENPIYRLSTREKRPDGKATKLLRVVAVERGVRRGPAWDMTTDDHYVYLPEHDVTVSQCDDYSVLVAAAMRSIGYPVVFRVIRSEGSGDWNHIYVLVGIPPEDPDKWVALDASMNKPAGWEVPRREIADVKDFEVG